MGWQKTGLGLLLGLCLALGVAWAAPTKPPKALSYTLTFDLKHPSILKVELEFIAPSAGEWRLRLGSKEGFIRHARWEIPPLFGLVARDARGQALPWRRDGEREWRVRCEQAGPLKVSYWLYDSGAAQSTDPRALARPFISREFVQLIGFESLLYPEELSQNNQSLALSLALEVKPQVPADWKLVLGNSYRSATPPLKMKDQQPLSAWLAQVFAAGIYTEAAWQTRQGQKGWVISPGRPGSPLLLPAAKLLSAITDAAEPLFAASPSVSAQAPHNPDLFILWAARAGKRSLLPISALHLENSVVLAYNPGAASPQQVQAALMEELAHEIAHRLTLGILADSAESWLKEGLAEFYGKRLLRLAGLWSRDEENAFWQRLRNEARQPTYAKADRSAAQRRFWKDAAWHRVAYARGALALHYLDLALEKSPEPRQGFDETVKIWQVKGIRLDTSDHFCQALDSPKRMDLCNNIKKILNVEAGFERLFALDSKLSK